MSAETLYRHFELLADALANDFAPGELEELVYRLGIEPGGLQRGPTQRHWAESLLRLLDATGRQMELYLLLRQLRPNGDWPRAFARPLAQAVHCLLYTSDAADE